MNTLTAVVAMLLSLVAYFTIAAQLQAWILEDEQQRRGLSEARLWPTLASWIKGSRAAFSSERLDTPEALEQRRVASHHTAWAFGLIGAMLSLGGSTVLLTAAVYSSGLRATMIFATFVSVGLLFHVWLTKSRRHAYVLPSFLLLVSVSALILALNAGT